jgi:hypothetical protein
MYNNNDTRVAGAHINFENKSKNINSICYTPGKEKYENWVWLTQKLEILASVKREFWGLNQFNAIETKHIIFEQNHVSL